MAKDDKADKKAAAKKLAEKKAVAKKLADKKAVAKKLAEKKAAAKKLSEKKAAAKKAAAKKEAKKLADKKAAAKKLAAKKAKPPKAERAAAPTMTDTTPEVAPAVETVATAPSEATEAGASDEESGPTRRELLVQAGQLGIVGRHRMSKVDLEAAVAAH